jgi:hypothetical protein
MAVVAGGVVRWALDAGLSGGNRSILKLTANPFRGLSSRQ